MIDLRKKVLKIKSFKRILCLRYWAVLPRWYSAASCSRPSCARPCLRAATSGSGRRRWPCLESASCSSLSAQWREAGDVADTPASRDELAATKWCNLSFASVSLSGFDDCRPGADDRRRPKEWGAPSVRGKIAWARRSRRERRRRFRGWRDFPGPLENESSGCETNFRTADKLRPSWADLPFQFLRCIFWRKEEHRKGLRLGVRAACFRRPVRSSWCRAGKDHPWPDVAWKTSEASRGCWLCCSGNNEIWILIIILVHEKVIFCSSNIHWHESSLWVVP